MASAGLPGRTQHAARIKRHPTGSELGSREHNTEADAIANGDFTWLKASNKVKTVMNLLPFMILPELLAQGEGFYSGSETVNLGAPSAPKDKRSLRVRDPWDL